MRFEELANSKERLLKDCENLIATLKSEYAKDRLDEAGLYNTASIMESRDKLISFVEAKQKALLKFNIENYEEISLEIEKTNERIYRQFYLLRQIVFVSKKKLKDSKPNSKFLEFKTQTSNELFDSLRNSVGTKEFMDKLRGCYYFCIKHFAIFTFILFLIGCLILFQYFGVTIGYFPNVSKDSALYFVSLAVEIGLLLGVYIGVMYAYPLYLIDSLRDKIDKKQKLEICFHIFLLIYCAMVLIFLSYTILRSIVSINTGHVLWITIVIVFLLTAFYLPVFIYKDINLVVGSFIIMIISSTIIIIILNPNIIRALHIGNYTTYYLVFDKAALDSIPEEIREAGDKYYQNLGESIKLIKPKILSNIGSEYFIEMKIPKVKNLALNSTCENRAKNNSSPTICKFKVESKFKKGEGDTIPPFRLD